MCSATSHKRLEYTLDFFWGDARSAIDYFKSGDLALIPQAENHLTLLGKFKRITKNVDNDLSQPAGIGPHKFR